MLKEKNYDFRKRHFQVHLPNRRRPGRVAAPGEILLDESWCLGCSRQDPQILSRALADFQDYLFVSQNISLKRTDASDAPHTLWLQIDDQLDSGFALDVQDDKVVISLAAADQAFRATIHLEDYMNLEGVPVLPKGHILRQPIYLYRNVHSGCGIDDFPDAELNAIVHGGYDSIIIFVKDFDVTTAGHCNINDVIDRAAAFGLKTFIYNYLPSFKHPDEPDAEDFFDSIYGELFRRYPKAAGLALGGESLEFPSKDPATTGKRYRDSFENGIPDPRPSPGWYPCSDYPQHLTCIERAVHRVKPDAIIVFSTYNWGWAPLELRRRFLENFPKGYTLSVCYEIFSQHTLEGLRTPVMDYTISADKPGYYFESEIKVAHALGIPIQGNVNTAGIGWDFGCVPWVPVPQRWLTRDRILREACTKYGVVSHYATHHYGWWDSPAADLGKWSGWKDFEPDYDQLLRKIAIRDYGLEAADAVLEAWRLWSEAMSHYVASNEDQYGPWRVGPAYPFIFQPNITRTMLQKEMKFPTAPQAHFGYRIIKTLYQPYENEQQAPGFLRYPAEIRSLQKMLALWEQGLQQAQRAKDSEEGQRLIALGTFIRNSICTTIHIKQWWRLNMAMQTSETAEQARKILDQIQDLLHVEAENVRATIPAVEVDSRIGWEPSMEYVCDRWHLEWKLRQLASAEREIMAYRNVLA